MGRSVFVLAAAIAFVLGCHGTELRVGAGRTNGGLDVHSATGGGGGWHGGTPSTIVDVSEDDSTTYYAELGFQLTPTSVVLRDERSLASSPLFFRSPQVEDVPVDEAHREMTLAEQIATNTKRLEELFEAVSEVSAASATMREEIKELREKRGECSADWTAIAVAALTLLLGGGAGVYEVRRRRKAKRG